MRQTPRADYGAFTASRLCLGTLTMSPLQAGLTPEEGAEIIVHAYRQGVDFVDTADLYHTYAHIAAALPRCPRLRVSTKCYAYDRVTAAAALERAFAIGRDHIDVMMLHEQESEHTLRGHREALDYFMERKTAGAIGMVGISTHRIAGVRAAVRWGLDIIHPLINMDGIGLTDGSLDEMIGACAEARAAGVAILGMKALGGGHLIGRALEAMRWAYLQPVDGIAVGMRTADEVDWHVAVACGEIPPEGLRRRVAETARSLYIHDWCTGCGACVRRCPQGALRIVDGRSAAEPGRCVLCGYCASACPEFCIKVV